MRAILEYELGNFDLGATSIARLKERAADTPPPGPIAEHVFMVGAITLTERIGGSDEHLTSAAESTGVLLSLPHLAPVMAMIRRRGAAARVSMTCGAVLRGSVTCLRQQRRAAAVRPTDTSPS